MNRLLLVVWRRLQRRLGWTGLCGAAALLAGAAGAVALGELRARQESLGQRIAPAHAQAVQQPLSAAPPGQAGQLEHGSAAQPRGAAAAPEALSLAHLSAQLPRLSENAADLEKLFALATVHQLTLAKGDYQLAADAASPVQAYTVTLPATQSYAVLRQFSAEVLRALPHAALDELRLERADAASTEAHARLRFTLIYRGE
jgi:hypothetical protein